MRIFGKFQIIKTQFINVKRYDASEVEAPPPLQYDNSIDERDLTVDEWRRALWEEVINWRPHPGYPPPTNNGTASTTTTTNTTQNGGMEE